MKTFELVASIGCLLPFAVTTVLLTLRYPRQRGIRAACAVTAAWTVNLVYTMYVYNPAGIAAGHAAGMHFPEGHYDNNTISVALLGGWMWPTMTALAVECLRRAIRWKNQGKNPDEPVKTGRT